MGFQERLSGAMQTSHMEWHDEKTMPVEFVASMAGVSHLGSDLFRAKGYDRAALHRAVLLLARKAWRQGHKRKLPMSDEQARALAKAALSEVIKPHCRVCTGAGVSIIDDLKVTCPSCEGVAVHRYTDKERAKLCGIPADKWKAWEGRYWLVLSIARNHDCAPMMASERLG